MVRLVSIIRVAVSRLCGDPGGRIGLIGLVAAYVTLGGCGSAPDGATDAPPADDPAGPAAFLFEGDDDPALDASGFIEDELLVRTLPGADAIDLLAFYADVGAAPIDRLEDIDTTVLSVAPENLVAAASLLAADDRIEGVFKNRLYAGDLLPNDPRISDQSHLSAMGLPDAWATTMGAADIIIAILDTGVSPTHPDLQAKLLAGYNTADDNADSSDVHGHGTAVAGAAAAIADNAEGVAGAAWNCPILPIRIARPDGRASSRAIAAGILKAVERGAKIINISFGPLDSDSTVLSAAQTARAGGSLVIIAAGNDGALKTSTDHESALFIGALAEDNTLASFSNRGPFVDFTAPGVRILTTDISGGYSRYNGTSFAAPLASGVAALVWSVDKSFKPATVESILTGSAQDLGTTGRDTSFGYGSIRADAAVALARQTRESTDRTPPTVSIDSPVANATVSGTTRVSVSASDVGGVASVTLFVDNTPLATDKTAPYVFSLNAAKLSVGTHTLTAVAADASGNQATSRAIRIIIAGATADTSPPTVTILSPSAGARVVGTVEARALMTDNAALSRVVWSVNGTPMRSQQISGTRTEDVFYWRTSALSTGAHTLKVSVTDVAGMTASAQISVTR